MSLSISNIMDYAPVANFHLPAATIEIPNIQCCSAKNLGVLSVLLLGWEAQKIIPL